MGPTARLHAACLALAFPSVLVGLDLVNPFCGMTPLAAYLAASALGIGFAVRRARRPEHIGRLRLWAVAIVAGLGVLGAISLVVWPFDRWDGKCGHASCGRALGVGLGESPFPVATPTCQHLSMCANEAPLSEDQDRALLELMDARGCAPP